MNIKALTFTSYFYLMSYAFAVTIIGPCNAGIDADFHAGERAMGALVSVHFIGFIVTTLYAGYLIDRIGLKPVMVAGVSLLGAMLVAFGLSRSLTALFIVMFIMGVGGGAVESSVNALVSAIHKDTRVYSLNLLHVFFGVGAFTWPMIAGYLLETGMSWRPLYHMIGAFSFAMALIVAAQKYPEAEAGQAVKLGDVFGMIKKPTVLLVGGVVAFYVGGEMGINTWVVRYFEQELQFKSAAAPVIGILVTPSFVLSFFWFTMTVGRLVATFAGKVVPDYILLRVVTALSAASAVTAFLVRSPLAAGFFIGLTGLFFSGIFATSVAIGGNRFPDRLGMISGIVIGFSGLGNVLFNYGVGEVAQRTGSIRIGLLFASAMLVCMAACAFSIKKPGEAYKGDG
ncbi:MAG: Glucose/mannose transporter GlcP [bacterium ADurb.Bin236]|nr:MAG: Glucose/mannose transporter GlcP [bacterium ADurb.Bin236]HPN95489.1 MFS transporter [bacterium]